MKKYYINEEFYYKTLFDIDNFEAWGGGLDTINSLTWEQRQEVGEWLIQIYDGAEPPTDVELNDTLWFEREQIYDMLGLDENGEEIDEDEQQ